MKAVEVLLPKPFDQPFTYLAPQNVQVGAFVKAPFRNQNLIGIVWEETQKKPAMKLKEVVQVFDANLYPKSMMKFVQWVAEYNIVELGKILKMSLSSVGAIEKPTRYEKEYEVVPHNLTSLSEQQQKVFNDIKDHNDFSVHVIDGVTGSGKTEVYLHLINEVINQGGQALVLLPEIVLTTQLISRFTERLGTAPLEWHSELGVKKRKENWLAAVNGKGKFFAGARSALFLPYKNLKLIIVDEEHDGSFKQEEGAIYNARDMAIIKAKEENIPIILSSATPSIETVHNIKLGKYSEHKLSSRFGAAVMPEVRLVDMLKDTPQKGKWLSQSLLTELDNTLKQQKQSLLFLNRRGYAPTTYCGNCHEKVSCPHCNFALVEHRSKNILQCHYCGHSLPKVTKCPSCDSDEKIYSLGPGVERIAEEVSEAFPDARVKILSSDTTPNRHDISEVIEEITDHKVDIIVGTQMITKGLHFPQLHLVGVIDAEGGIFGCDIRAVERTYQLLHQVSGRAGREKDRGLVIIQTNDAKSPLLKYLVEGNVKDFVASELEDREVANVPPFSRLATITASSKQEIASMKYMQELIKNAPDLEGVNILGPSPCPIFVLRGRYRNRLIVQGNKNINIQKIIRRWIANNPTPKNIVLKVDIDPLNFS